MKIGQSLDEVNKEDWKDDVHPNKAKQFTQIPVMCAQILSVLCIDLAISNKKLCLRLSLIASDEGIKF